MADKDAMEFSGRILDARGLYCPEPVMMLHNMVRQVEPGETIKVLATDPSTKRDIPKFCQFLGHAILQNSEELCMESTDGGKTYVFVIAKSTSTDRA